MALKKIARIGDSISGHVDVQGNAVIGTITTGKTTVHNGTKAIATTDDNINIPSHPHQLDAFGNPTDYRSHNWRIVGTGKHKIANKTIARDGDGANDGDWDGYQNKPSESSIIATTTTLYCA